MRCEHGTSRQVLQHVHTWTAVSEHEHMIDVDTGIQDSTASCVYLQVGVVLVDII